MARLCALRNRTLFGHGKAQTIEDPDRYAETIVWNMLHINYLGNLLKILGVQRVIEIVRTKVAGGENSDSEVDLRDKRMNLVIVIRYPSRKPSSFS